MQKSVGGHAIEVGNPDKVLFGESGLTKADLVDFYERVAEHLLRHSEGRLVSMHRFPDGIDGESFFQKQAPDYFPDWIRREEVEKEGGKVTMVVLEDAATLVYLADQACITPHVWLSKVDSPNTPDRVVFDFDPSGGAEFDDVRRAARDVKEVLEETGLTPFVMTSGSRGLHVWAPLVAGAEFDEVRGFARSVAELLAARHPDRLTIEQRKDKRGDRVFIDYLRNAYAQTSAPPYSVRPRDGAPVATPLDWDELGAGDLHPRKYTIRNLFRRLARKEDPWKGMGRHAASLEGPRERLESMREAGEEG